MKVLKIMVASLFMSVALASAADSSDSVVATLGQLSRGAAAAGGSMPDLGRLPFPPITLNEQQKNESVYVPQDCHAILSDSESGIRSAVVGYLYPCIGFFVRHAGLGKIAVFHISINRLDIGRIGEILKHAFNKDMDGSKWGVVIFTKRYKGEDKWSETKSGEELQKEVVKSLSNFVKKKGCTHVHLHIAQSPDFGEGCCEAYKNADRTVFVDCAGLFSLSLSGQSLLISPDRRSEIDFFIEVTRCQYRSFCSVSLDGIPPSERGFQAAKELERVPVYRSRTEHLMQDDE